jgi:hypothetical protein
VGELVESLAKDSVADATPLDCGVNITVTDALFPALMVIGKEGPVTTNSELLLVADVTVTLAPEAVSVPPRVALFPTVTLPKLNVDGETVNWPAEVPVPVPVSGTVRLAIHVGFEKTIFPEALPLEAGANVRVKV